MEQRALSAAIRAHILSGVLPSHCEHQLVGGSGAGAPCTCCNRQITSDQMQYNIEVPTVYGERVSMPMHIACYGVWRAECSRSVTI